MVKQGFGNHLGGRIGLSGIFCVHAHRVIQPIEENRYQLLNDLEVANHLVFIELIGFKYELNSSRMAMRKGALIRVLAEHVTALDLEGLTNSKWHATE
jgi:hypothetical protein